MTHNLTLTPLPFSQIASGTKVIESRLYDEKRQRISVDDTIIFSERDNPQNTLRVTVTALYRHKSFSELFATHDAKLFGGESTDALLAQIRTFYTLEDEQKYGVAGIRFMLT
jgi:ASC-1-like (ASCH) protein